MQPFEVETAVLCDDIRQEQNGKYILIGVYGGNIILRRLPTNLRLSLWLLARTKTSGKFDAKIRVVGQQGAILAEGTLNIDVKNAERALIMAIPGLPMQVQSEGKIQIELGSTGQDEWTPIKIVDVTLAPPRVPPTR